MSEREQSIIRIIRYSLVVLVLAALSLMRFKIWFRTYYTSLMATRWRKVNLNRQNYTENDIGRYKAECLAERLLSINPDAQIDFHTEFLTPDNIEKLLNEHDVAINALDFKDKTPFVFDEMCKERKIPVLHPYNFGWAGFVNDCRPIGAFFV